MELKRAELKRSTESELVEIWPEHWRAADVFFAMSTQWNVITRHQGMNGGLHHQGLKYEVLELVERRLPLDPEAPSPPDATTLFDQLQTLERAALKHLNAT